MKKDFHEVVLVENPSLRMIEERLDGFSYMTTDKLFIIQSWEKAADGELWMHTSFSRKSRMPEYKDMKRVKEIFIGDDRPAYMIFPGKEFHVNLHAFCLHFFTPISGDGLPEFSYGGMTL